MNRVLNRILGKPVATLAVAAAMALAGPAAAQVPEEIATTQSAPLYSDGTELQVSCTFSFPAGRQLLSLLWAPELPAGWSLVSASGDGLPAVDPDASTIAFVGGDLGAHNPVTFTYRVAVPTGTTGPLTLGGSVEYQLDDMVNPGDRVAPVVTLSDADAAHVLDGYLAGHTQTVACSFAYPAGRQLQSLLWVPELPSGWTVVGAFGQGGPLVDGDGAVAFLGGDLPGHNPVQFSYEVHVPAGTTGPKSLGGQAEFQLDGMANPVTARALPDPLTVRPLHTLEIRSAHGLPAPAVGIYTNFFDSILTNRVDGRVTLGSRTFACTGWLLEGNDPVTGAGTSCVMTVTNDAVLNWVWVAPLISPAGSVSVTMDEDNAPQAWVQPALSAITTSDPAGTLTWSLKTAPAHGSATVTGTGPTPTISYAPVANWHGADSFVVEVSDGLGGLDQVTVAVTVQPRNDPPVNTTPPGTTGIHHTARTLAAQTGAWNDAVEFTPGPLAFTYQWQRANADDGDGALDIPGATDAMYALTLDDNGRYVRVQVTCTDDAEGEPAAQSTVASTAWVLVSNNAPVIAQGGAVSAVMDEDGSPTAWLMPAITATDADEIDTLTWSLKTAAANGTATAGGTGASPSVTYAPAANWYGTDSFVVEVSDGLGGLDEVTVAVTVNPRNDAPVLDAIGAQTVDEQQLLSFTATAADLDVPAQNLTFTLDPSAIAAGMAITPDGVFSWTPTEEQGGQTYSATVTVTDDGTAPDARFDSETFTIVVAEVNRAPVLAPLSDQLADEQSTLTFTASATDPDRPDQGLTFTVDPASYAAGMRIDPVTGVFTWTPAPGQAGTEGQSYTVYVTVTDDGANPAARSDTGSFTIGVADSRGTHETIGYLAGRTARINCTFSHPAGKQLQSLLWTPVLPPGWTIASVSGDGGPTIDPDGTALAFLGGDLPTHNPVRFSYVVNVPAGVTGPQSLRAVAEYQTEGMANPFSVWANPDPLIIPELHTLEVVSVQDSCAPAVGIYTNLHGTVLTNTVTAPITIGTRTFESTGWTLVGVEPATGQGHAVTLALTNDAVLTWNWVAPLITPATSVSVTMDEDGSPIAWVQPALSASEPYRPALVTGLVWSLLSGPSHGSATVFGTGAVPAIVYAPATNWYGDDSFVVGVADGLGGFDQVTVAVTVQPVNDAPVLAAIGDQRTDEFTPLTFTASASDVDIPVQSLTYSLDAASEAEGMTIDPGTGVFSWTPSPGQAGADLRLFSVIVTVTDNGSGPAAQSDSETITITLDSSRATHTAVGYTAGTNFEIACTFVYPAGRQLQSLLWTPELPAGWTLVSASGDGTPTVDPDGSTLTFLGNDLPTHNPVTFRYTVGVPAGVTGPQPVGGVIEYQMDGMANPATVRAQPDPLVVPMLLTLTNLVVSDKVYDGTTNATVSSYGSLVGLVPGHDVSLVTTGAVAWFETPQAGTDKTVIVTGLTLSGTNASWYAISAQTTTATIAKAAAVIAVTPYSVSYDGLAHTASGTATGVTNEPLAGLDLSGTTHTNAGTYVDGWTFTDVTGNYLDASGTVTDVIARATLTITGLIADNKIYDGTTAATVGGTAELGGVVGDDDVTLGGTPVYAFASKNVATGIVITTTGYSLGGADAGNYNLTQPALSADITPRTLTVTADDKMKIHGTVDPSFTATLDGLVDGETAAVLDGTLAFTRTPGEDVGVYTVTPSGLTSANYTISFLPGTLTIVEHALILAITSEEDPALVRVTWASLNNATYRLQFNTDMRSSHWTDVPGDITATDVTAHKLDIAPGPHRFYRVLIVP